MVQLIIVPNFVKLIMPKNDINKFEKLIIHMGISIMLKSHGRVNQNALLLAKP